MSSQHLLAAALLAGTIFTPVAGAARDRGDNDFTAASQPDEEEEEEEEEEEIFDRVTDNQTDNDEDPITDLDNCSPTQLERELSEELDDVFELIRTDNPVTLQQAFNAVMYALSDEDDDPDESVVDFDELEAEMEEAGTTLEEVVWDALNEADEYVGRPTPGIYKVASRDVFLAASDGMATRKPVFAKVKPHVIRFIRDYR